jgi:hypothetical protein
LPINVTVNEISEYFSKCGIIQENIETSKSRVKQYFDENWQQKDECLIVLYRPRGVALVIQMLDETDLRPIPDPTGPMRVQEAEFKPKTGETPKLPVNDKFVKRLAKKREKPRHKISEWGDKEISQVLKNRRSDRTVILKNIFIFEELNADPGNEFELRE